MMKVRNYNYYYLLLLFTAHVVFSIWRIGGAAAVDDDDEVVVDMFGNNLLLERSYYIAPAGILKGDNDAGGLTINGTSSSCPINVIQEEIPFWYGAMWNLHQIHVTDEYVHTSSDMFVSLDSTNNPCPDFPMWTYNSDETIQVGVRIALAGCNGARSTYRIEAVNPPVYKFTTSNACGLQIYDVVVNKQRQLCADIDRSEDEPFYVVFTPFSPRLNAAAAAAAAAV